jgi:dienelactone hydrolase
VADYLLARGDIDHLIIGGLCSGAEDAFRFAEHEPRVCRVVLIDPFSYRTAGWHWRHLAHRAARRALRAAGTYQPIARSHGLINYAYMEQAESSRILRALIARGTHVHFVYTGGSHDTFNHAGQLADMFPDLRLAPLVTVDYLPRLDHTQLLAEDRDTVVATIARRLATRP